MDSSSWVCMNVYTVKNHVRKVHFLSLCKMNESETVKNLFHIVMNTLCMTGRLDGLNIARNLVCFGADGAPIMQGNCNCHYILLQTNVAPCMIGRHCVAH